MKDRPDPSDQQQAAVRAIASWARTPGTPRTYYLDGPAGSGKTTVAELAAQAALNGRDVYPAVYVAFTGKAAHVLRTKGAEPTSTIHSLIYMPPETVKTGILQLRERRNNTAPGAERDQIDTEIRRLTKKVERPGWVLRDDLKDPAGLIVVDEASMLDNDLLRDLASFEVRILALGDSAQLPPINGNGGFLKKSPDFKLTEVHRQASGSPVIVAATSIRESGDVSDLGANSVRVLRAAPGDYEQVLCWRNATRWQIINALRAGLPDLPQPGEKIMVLQNNHRMRVFNGQQFTVLYWRPHPKKANAGVVAVHAENDPSDELELEIDAAGFYNQHGEREASRAAREGSGLIAATHCNAITVHKSQGSQWDSVLVVDETKPMIFGMHLHKGLEQGKPKQEALSCAYLEGRRWLYTAVTRAAKHVAVVPLAGVSV